jgi:D-sedoheptulose 7-phosphate isomerase
MNFLNFTKNKSMNSKRIADHFNEAHEVLKQFNTAENHKLIEQSAIELAKAIGNNKKIISCGNGGSMCDAMHFAEELTGRYRNNRKAIPAISISDPSHLSCVSNDFGYEFVFSRFVEAFGQEGDVLLAISTSGNSNNVLKAIDAAKEKKMTVIGLTGKDGGKMKDLCDIEIRAPYSEFADRAQEIHIKVIHSLIDSIESLI